MRFTDRNCRKSLLIELTGSDGFISFLQEVPDHTVVALTESLELSILCCMRMEAELTEQTALGCLVPKIRHFPGQVISAAFSGNTWVLRRNHFGRKIVNRLCAPGTVAQRLLPYR